jgi:His-Xaa-Ser system protein HxsD
MSEIAIDVDPQVYRLSAVKKAAYRLGDRCFAQIEIGAEGRIQVRLTPKSDKVSLQGLAGDFRQELLDQELRESIAQETERVRNLILAQAFSGVSLTDPAAETADYREDPLDIGRRTP